MELKVRAKIKAPASLWTGARWMRHQVSEMEPTPATRCEIIHWAIEDEIVHILHTEEVNAGQWT